MPKNVKIPKKIAGVKLPKKVRKKAKKAIKAGAGPVVREIAAAALGAAARQGECRPRRQPASRSTAARIGEAFRSAAIDGLRRFLEGLEEGLREAGARATTRSPSRRRSLRPRRRRRQERAGRRRNPHPALPGPRPAAQLAADRAIGVRRVVDVHVEFVAPIGDLAGERGIDASRSPGCGRPRRAWSASARPAPPRRPRRDGYGPRSPARSRGRRGSSRPGRCADRRGPRPCRCRRDRRGPAPPGCRSSTPAASRAGSAARPRSPRPAASSRPEAKPRIASSLISRPHSSASAACWQWQKAAAPGTAPAGSPASAASTSSRDRPEGVLELGRVEPERVRFGAGEAGDHQRARERPGLAGDVAHVADGDARFLHQLARHRLLDRFAGLDEAGQRRIAARRILRLAGEQDAAVMLGEHDHDRIDAREMLGAAIRAFAAPAGAVSSPSRSRKCRRNGGGCAIR